THADRTVDRTARRSGPRSVAVGASAVSPRRLRPADQPIRARESMSVLRRRPKMRQTVAFMAPPSTRSWTRYPWRISAARRQRVLSLSAYATKIGRSLVPAVYNAGDALGRLLRTLYLC